MLYANIEVVDSFAYLESIVANSFLKDSSWFLVAEQVVLGLLFL